MGFSAGLILTATGGILVSTMHGKTRHDAWLLWRGAGMAGMVLGPVIGPLIATASNWRRLFIADAVLMLVALAIGAHAMKESRDEDSVFTFDLLLPALLLGLGLLSPYLALLTGKEHLASWPLSAAIVVAGDRLLAGLLAFSIEGPRIRCLTPTSSCTTGACGSRTSSARFTSVRSSLSWRLSR